MLKVKELQLFDSKAILSLFNICTQVPKKCFLKEFEAILIEAQAVAKLKRTAERINCV